MRVETAHDAMMNVLTLRNYTHDATKGPAQHMNPGTIIHRYFNEMM